MVFGDLQLDSRRELNKVSIPIDDDDHIPNIPDIRPYAKIFTVLRYSEQALVSTTKGDILAQNCINDGR